MRTALFGVLAVLVLIWPAARSFLGSFLDLLIRAFTIITKPIARAMGVVLRPDPRTTSVDPSRWAIWIGANLAALAIFFAVGHDVISLSLVLALALAHLLLLIAGQLAILEDFSILDGVQQRESRDFAYTTPVRRPAAIFISLTFFLLFLSLLLQKTESAHKGLLFEALPATGVSLADYSAMLFGCVPIFGGAVRSYFEISDSSFTFLGNGLRNAIYFACWSFAFSVLYMILTQQRSIDSILTILQKPKTKSVAENEMIGYAMLRAQRAPGFAKRQMIGDATHHQNAVYRDRLFKIIPKIGAFGFVPTFLYNLHNEKDEQLKLKGLDAVVAVLDSANAGLADKYQNDVRACLKYQINNRKHGDEVKEKLRMIQSMLEASTEEAEKALADPEAQQSTTESKAAVVTEVEQEDEIATPTRVLGRLKTQIVAARRNFNVTGHMEPRMSAIPQKTVASIVLAPDGVKEQIVVRAAAGTNFDFHIVVKSKDPVRMLPAGRYEFAYELET